MSDEANDDFHEGNEVEDILQKFTESPEADELDFSSCELETIPEQVVDVAKDRLTSLTLDYNTLYTVPALIQHLKHLLHLSINGNELCDLPAEISHLKSLETLSVSENRLVW